jgi:hypothetical protein
MQVTILTLLEEVVDSIVHMKMDSPDCLIQQMKETIAVPNMGIKNYHSCQTSLLKIKMLLKSNFKNKMYTRVLGEIKDLT